MKISGARRNTNDTFGVEFDDGIVVILDKKLNYSNMLSLGPGSYLLQKGKWPKGKNLEKRLSLGQAWIDRNKNRYRKAKKK